jgi:hypothetical protein
LKRLINLFIGSVLAAVGVSFLAKSMGYTHGDSILLVGLGVFLLINAAYLLKAVFFPKEGSTDDRREEDARQ